MSDDLQHLSRQLYESLEIVGASESLRQVHQQSSIVKDITRAIEFSYYLKKQFNVHHCGSSYEGSVTPDTASDIDIIFCHTDLPVVLDVNCKPHGFSLIMALDIWTYPGYVKLQWVWDGRRLTKNKTRSLPLHPYCRYDAVGRVCHEHFKGNNMHGPAIMGMDPNGEHISDSVVAYKCDNIPAYTNEWIHRKRNHSWPTSEQLDTMSRMGCIVVPVGHWESPERDIEWRMSFSLQERFLMSSLNPVQHKVYIVLKMIKKTILGSLIEGESLSSYHCKTCILYAVEETPADFWTPDNMINCVLYCLRLLLQWTQDSYCPNYFIKTHNLFSKEGFMRIRDQLRSGLNQMIQMKHHLVYHLESDSITDIMSDGEMRSLRPDLDARKYEYMFTLKRYVINQIIRVYHRIVHTSKDLSCTLGELQSTDGISGHTKHETQEVVNCLEPWLHLHIAKSLVAEAIDTHDRHSANILLTKADEHFYCTSRTDVTSVRFAKASILYAYRKYEECMRLLMEIERDLTFQVLSYCPCKNSRVYHVNNEQQGRDLTELISQMPVTNIIKHHYARCVVFTKSESRITPTALQYEMYRSLDTEPGSRDVSDFWFDFAVVDARVYLYFLQYLVYEALHEGVHKTVALDNIKAEIEKCTNCHIETRETILHHKDTAYNLLGWIYLQQNRAAEAYTCFTESLNIRSEHNAAKFHLTDMQL